MFKIIAIIVLLAIAAYCSYQIAVIVNWQTMLKNKQKSFGVEHKSSPSSMIGTMKQIRAISATCAALTLVVPGNLLSFNKGTNQMLVAEGIQDEDIAKKDAADVRGAEKSSAFHANDAPTMTFTTAVTAAPAAPASPDVSIAAVGTRASHNWNTIQSDLDGIGEIVIESYPEAPEDLSEARLKSLLLKSLREVDYDFGDEHYVVKLVTKTGEGIVLSLKQDKGTFYLLDRDSGIVYVLE